MNNYHFVCLTLYANKIGFQSIFWCKKVSYSCLITNYVKQLIFWKQFYKNNLAQKNANCLTQFAFFLNGGRCRIGLPDLVFASQKSASLQPSFYFGQLRIARCPRQKLAYATFVVELRSRPARLFMNKKNEQLLMIVRFF